MSEARHVQAASPGTVSQPPVLVVPARPAGSAWRGVLVTLAMALILCGVPVGALWLVLNGLLGAGDDSDFRVHERHFAGQRSHGDKIAIVRVEGVLMEGMLRFAHGQIERAAEDPQVKAVVLRINSPGGTISASDDLHHRLMRLRDGDSLRRTAGKPLVASMGSMAASGGYYIAMPAQTLFAEQTTITGSIGVFAAFPNVKELADKIGLRMVVLKRGRVKDSGSPFQEIQPVDRALWQGLVDHAYEHFQRVVEQGRPHLKGKLEEEVLPRSVSIRVGEGDHGREEQVRLVRQRSDGGTFTASDALELGLIDRIGYLEDAIEAARVAGGLGEEYQVVRYERPLSLSTFLGLEARAGSAQLEIGRLADALTPRLWYLSGHEEFAAFSESIRESLR